MRSAGTVKWFNDAKGFGFIRPADGTDDCFVHYTAIREGGVSRRRSLAEGQAVEFTIVAGEVGKGPRADDVIRIG